LAILVILSLLAGRPEEPGILLKKFKGRPLLAFFVFLPTLFLLLLLIPPFFSHALLDYREHFKDPGLFSFVNRPYGKKVFLLSLIFSISFADIVLTFREPSHRSRSWILFLAYMIGSAPLLWWNGLARQFPSRVLSFWRPILTGATCLPIVLAFPLMQPIIHASPSFESVTHRKLNDCVNAYQAASVPGENRFLLTCSKPDPALGRYTRSDWGEWRLQAPMTPMNFTFCQMAPDFKRGLGYIIDGNSRTLYVVRLPSFEIESTHDLPLGVFPVRNFNIRTIFIPEKDLLVAADETGFLAAFDAANQFKARATKYFADQDQLWALKYCLKQNELYVLMSEYIYSFDLDDFSLKRQGRLHGKGCDCLADCPTDRLFISFPEQARVLVLDSKTFKPIRSLDAPFGVRTLGMDFSRRLLFVSSISGIMEIYNADDLSRKHWFRLGRWIHWIEVLPEPGEAVVTMGEYEPSVIVGYDPPVIRWNLMDRLVKTSQDIAHSVMHDLDLLHDQNTAPSQKAPSVIEAGDTILFVSMNGHYRKSASIPLNGQRGFNILFAEREDDFYRLLDQNKGKIDFGLIDPTGFENEEFARTIVNILTELSIPHYTR
jgi:hypothetical protein